MVSRRPPYGNESRSTVTFDRVGLVGSAVRHLQGIPATSTRGVSSKNSRSFTPRPADPTTVGFSLNRSELSEFPALAGRPQPRSPQAFPANRDYRKSL